MVYQDRTNSRTCASQSFHNQDITQIACACASEILRQEQAKKVVLGHLIDDGGRVFTGLVEIDGSRFEVLFGEIGSILSHQLLVIG
jgi:hypothetical protein